MSDWTFHAVLAACAAMDAVIAGAVLAARRAPISPRSIGRAALVVVGVFLVRSAALFPLGLSPFGMIHQAYVDLVVVVPAFGLALLIGSRFRRNGRGPLLTPSAQGLAVAALGLAAVGVEATYLGPYRLRVETATVDAPTARVGTDEVRIAVLADLQTDRVGDHERAAVDRLLALRPDIILIPGDVFQGTNAAFEAQRPALRRLLGRLSAPGGVYLVQGDVDRAAGRIARLVEGTAIRPLFNEITRVAIGDRRITLAGVELDYRSADARATVHALETATEQSDLRILLAHRPDVALGLTPHSRIDLVVAGHTHGGQVVVPGFGPPLTLSRVPRAVAAGGLHQIAGNAIYVSRGVGHEHGQAPRLRLFCPPEISLLTVHSR